VTSSSWSCLHPASYPSPTRPGSEGRWSAREIIPPISHQQYRHRRSIQDHMQQRPRLPHSCTEAGVHLVTKKQNSSTM
jgi:hypothetical protein